MDKNTDLTRLFMPRSVALIGASKDPTKRSGAPLRILLKAGYKGNIYPINPKYDELEGIKCYPSIKEIEGEIDLALILLPAKIVPKVLKQCAEKGVRFAVIISAGWAEIGGQGAKRQKEIQTIAEQSGIRICGPNTLGMIGFRGRIPATYLECKDFTPGNVGLIFQSGALSGMVKLKAEARNINFSHWVSSGNEADLTTLDYAGFMVDDPSTEIIVIYMEGIKDGKQFKILANKAVKKETPIAILKVGRSQLGKETAKTHTGSIAGSYTAYQTFFKQYGIIQTDSIDELLDLASFVSHHGTPKLANVAIASFSGGAAVQFADSYKGTSLNIPKLGHDAVKKLSQLLPDRVIIKNPLDLAGGIDPESYDQVVHAFAKDKNIDAIVFLLGWWGPRVKTSAESLTKAAKNIDKPILVVWSTPESVSEQGIRKMQESGVIVLPSISRCVKVLDRLNQYKIFLENYDKESHEGGRSPTKGKTLSLDESQGKTLTEFESKRWLQQYDIPVTSEELVKTEEEAVQAAKKMGYPIALKVMSPDILHKSDADVINLKIQNDEQLLNAYRKVLNNAKRFNPQARIEGVLVQEMVEDSGAEVIVGVTKDDIFGPMIMVGLGGVFTEILEDVSFRIAPLTRKDAEEMLKEIKGYPILKGTRGKPPLDIKALIEVLIRISNLVVEHTDIGELDINPLLLFPKGKGTKVVDALIRVE